MSRFPVRVAVATAALALALLPAVAQAATSPTPVPMAPPSPRSPDALARAWRASAPASVVVGRSVQGRAVVAQRQGPADAPYVLLVLGQMHGTEPRGRDVVREVRALAPPSQVQVWTIVSMNPDGAAYGRRTNAHGIDLNRNFPYRWSPRWPAGQRFYYPGTRPASEPEVRAMMAFLDRLRPDLIVSMHQHYNSVDLGSGKTLVWSQRLAAQMRLRLVVVPCSIGPCTGTMTAWFNHGHPGSAVTVELPYTVTRAMAAAYARAILRVGRTLVPAAG